MTDCNVAGVFGQNGTIQTGTGGRERLAEEWAREREMLLRHRQDRAGRSNVRQMEGVEELAKLSLTAMGALLTIQEYCLKSICHLGAVEPVITMWYSFFHSDNLFTAFSVHPAPQLYKRSLPSIHLCLPI